MLTLRLFVFSLKTSGTFASNYNHVSSETGGNMFGSGGFNVYQGVPVLVNKCTRGGDSHFQLFSADLLLPLFFKLQVQTISFNTMLVWLIYELNLQQAFSPSRLPAVVKIDS